MDSCSGGSWWRVRARRRSRLTTRQRIRISWRVSGYWWGSTWGLRLGRLASNWSKEDSVMWACMCWCDCWIWIVGSERKARSLSTLTPKTGTSTFKGTFSLSSCSAISSADAGGVALRLRRDAGFTCFHLLPLLLGDSSHGVVTDSECPSDCSLRVAGRESVDDAFSDHQWTELCVMAFRFGLRGCELGVLDVVRLAHAQVNI